MDSIDEYIIYVVFEEFSYAAAAHLFFLLIQFFYSFLRKDGYGKEGKGEIKPKGVERRTNIKAGNKRPGQQPQL